MFEIFVAATAGGVVGTAVTIRLIPRYIARLPEREQLAFARKVARLRDTQ